MHNYVILSMTATIVMMGAAMEQKKEALFPEGTVFLRIKICFLCSKDLLPSVIKSDF